MKNQAKCKLCESVIESFFLDDYVMCKCEEIAIWGGAHELGCKVKTSWDNFLRLDEKGKEIPVRYQGKQEPPKEPPLPTRKQLIDELGIMIEKDTELPEKALYQPVTHYDLLRYATLVHLIFIAHE